MEPSVAPITAAEGLSDEDIVRRVRHGEVALFELLMRRHNARLYRTVRALRVDEDEVEEIMQDAYVAAYANLHTFRGTARFATWLSRIAWNHALMRLRQRRRLVALDAQSEEDALSRDERAAATPELETSRGEVRRLLARAVDALPERYRSAFVLRDVEGLSTQECADVLGTSEDVVKTRLHRARAMLRRSLTTSVENEIGALFPFHAARCDRVVRNVLRRLSVG